MAVTPCVVSFGWAGEEREVKLVKKDGVWTTAHFVQGQPDPKIAKLYGSNELPTPWSDTIDRETVVQSLTVINPHIKFTD
jgi:hypothetical protein